MSQTVPGDFSGDGKINTGDYVALRRAILNQVKLSKAQELAGDIDKNGKLQAKDYIVRRGFLPKLVDRPRRHRETGGHNA